MIVIALTQNLEHEIGSTGDIAIFQVNEIDEVLMIITSQGVQLLCTIVN